MCRMDWGVIGLEHGILVSCIEHIWMAEGDIRLEDLQNVRLSGDCLLLSSNGDGKENQSRQKRRSPKK